MTTRLTMKQWVKMPDGSFIMETTAFQPWLGYINERLAEVTQTDDGKWIARVEVGSDRQSQPYSEAHYAKLWADRAINDYFSED